MNNIVQYIGWSLWIVMTSILYIYKIKKSKSDPESLKAYLLFNASLIVGLSYVSIFVSIDRYSHITFAGIIIGSVIIGLTGIIARLFLTSNIKTVKEVRLIKMRKISISMSNEKIVWYGLLLGIVFGALGCWVLWNHGDTRLQVYMNIVLISIGAFIYLTFKVVDREWIRRKYLTSLLVVVIWLVCLNGLRIYFGTTDNINSIIDFLYSA